MFTRHTVLGAALARAALKANMNTSWVARQVADKVIHTKVGIVVEKDHRPVRPIHDFTHSLKVPAQG